VAGLIISPDLKTFSISTIRLFHVFIICVVTSITLFISFKNFSFAFTSWLFYARGLASFQLVLALDIPSSLSLTICNFLFKLKDVFLLLEHLEAIEGLLIALFSMFLCFRE
jgi:hypothetical protein